ncbi:TPA: RpoE-regulated lipoprotein [Raoultella ornithinolytica]|uniref:RpoE-regulated lipoprotein n=1 Tax=Raoultella ornithinolytica TaxID=54291 RepID=UPI0018A6FB74|nr:RpoE-regulated lipoprotein [Raoultella ornithinolytica]QPG39428.1 RpoE-regulated lipoprotein [Raoultella ornithinolytica]WKL85074.1 RpoE-regulated lipoprotein [Raoultella ornithinolytica]HBC7114732.1 RpoE-regulated lipoprotein [Raoultella ornithinolytica]HBC8968838.1 RpoE-regulated lipoprotein [Raoultella ornithinolytica]HCE8952903.1 RpoE-regulated lipoprotein [Raoultella ornithinolytica]
MKSLRLLLCALPLALTGCSTMSAVNWSAAYPWNWFGSSMEVTEQGVGKLTATTPLNEQAISDALGGSYRLRSGMKAANGNIVRYFEALKDDKVAMTINGDGGTINRIEVRDSEIKTDRGVQVGTPFSELYSKAFGHCQKGANDNGAVVECQADGSQHISYAFTGHWNGPEELMPSDDTLKNWKVSKIIWHG